MGNGDKGTNTKTITVFGTFPNIESIVAKMSDCISLPPKANNIIYQAPAEDLNSLDLKTVSELTAVDPSVSPKTNNVMYSASIIRKHDSKNVISKMSESENDTMGRASKNVVNNMSKSETFNKTKLSVETGIRENSSIYTRWSPSSYEMDIGTYSISDHPTVSNHITLILDSTAAQIPVVDQVQAPNTQAAGQIQFPLTNSLPRRESFMRDTVLQHSMRAMIPLTFA